MVKALNHTISPQDLCFTSYILYHFGKRMNFFEVYKPNIAKIVYISILHFSFTRIKQ